MAVEGGQDDVDGVDVIVDVPSANFGGGREESMISCSQLSLMAFSL